MTRYTSVTDADLSEMLATIGVGSIDELFADIPAGASVAELVYVTLQGGQPAGREEPVKF